MDSSPLDRNTLNHAHLCLSWRPAAAGSAAQLHVGGERRRNVATSVPNLLSGQPPRSSPSFLPQDAMVQDSILLSPSCFSSLFRQLFPKTDPNSPRQPREWGFQPPSPSPHSIPGSPQLTCHLSTSILLSPDHSLHAVDSVNSVCQASGQEQEGLGSRHLPYCSAGWAQAGPLHLPPCCPSAAGAQEAEQQCLVLWLQQKDTGRARSWWTAKSNFVTAQQNEASLESASDSQEVGLGVLFCILRSLQGH